MCRPFQVGPSCASRTCYVTETLCLAPLQGIMQTELCDRLGPMLETALPRYR